MIARRTGWTLLGLGVVSVAVLPIAGLIGHHPARALANVPLVVIYVGIGAVAFLQRPDSRAARRLLAFGVSLAGAFALGAVYSAYVDRSGTPGWSGVAVLALTAAGYTNGATALALFAVFPDGAYQRRSERMLVRVSWTALPVLMLLQVLGAERLHVNAPSVWQNGDVVGHNPLAVPGLHTVGDVATGLLGGSQLWVIVGVVVLILRYRRAAAEARRQIAWPLYALALTVVATAVLGFLSSRINNAPAWEGYLLFYPVLLLIPAGLLVGMLKHRLFDITLVIRRSVVYAVLWLLIAVLYVGVAATFGMLVGHRMPLDLAILLTIIVTVVFAPVRRRVERLCNRLVFGERVSGYELIGRLGTRLEASLAPDDVVDEVVRAVQDGIGAAWVRVVVGTPRPRDEEPPALTVPLVHGDDVVGALLCGPKRDGEYRPSDETLLATLGRQAALALRTAQLTDELSARLAELAASRARLVEAEEAGRRRIERDLHDGVQQELVALITRLSMARNQLRRDSEQAATTVAQAQRDARRALESLQELVRGIHPAVLTDRGLLEAVQELVTRLPVPVRVEDVGFGSARLEPGIESGAYFVVAEALANVLKHAGATSVRVRLVLTSGELIVQVADDGRGFALDGRPLRGLEGLRDRIEALDGRLVLTSDLGRGSTIEARLPASVAVSA